MNIDIDPDAMAKLYELYDDMLEKNLGPMMEEQVKHNATVDLGNLRESVVKEVDRHTHTLYINRCTGGCKVTQGSTDNRTDHSDIAAGIANLAAFGQPQQVWDDMMSCLREVYSRFNLVVTDIEMLRLHYADTLKHWGQRFAANRDKAKAIYDERFCRMWEFYLAASEAAFRWQDLVIFQIQLTKKNDTLPMTRDYMANCEKALEMRDLGRGQEAPVAKSARRRKVADRE